MKVVESHDRQVKLGLVKRMVRSVAAFGMAQERLAALAAGQLLALVAPVQLAGLFR